jgi:hypothetical protein
MQSSSVTTVCSLNVSKSTSGSPVGIHRSMTSSQTPPRLSSPATDRSAGFFHSAPNRMPIGIVERDVADVDTHDRLIAVVEQDRAPDVRLGLLLAVVLHRRDDGERHHGAAVGDLDLVGLGQRHALEIVVAATGT